MISTFQEAEEYLAKHIREDIFTRFDADKHLTDPLERMRYFLKLINNPQTKFASVQVTGTSGKGSTAYLISHILATAGYKVGFTHSPHLQTPLERMQINNKNISEAEFGEVLNDIIPAIEQMTSEPIGKPSYFEIILAMALHYFAKQKIQIAVAEVGLEGKYDGTNVLDPLVVVLTNISLDHTAILGDTVEKIASEAVSAIKEQSLPPVVVTGKLRDGVEEIVRAKSEKVGALMAKYGEDFKSHIKENEFSSLKFNFLDKSYQLSDLTITLKGEYQIDNASLAIQAVRELADAGFFVTEEHIRKALQTAFFPGRFEVFTYQGKTLILDGAHNPAKIAAFLQALTTYYPTTPKTFIIGFKRDKELSAMLELLLQEKADFIFTEFHTSTDYARSISAQLSELREQVEEYSRDAVFSENIHQALEMASQQDNELIVVTGSLYLVGEVRNLLTSQNR